LPGRNKVAVSACALTDVKTTIGQMMEKKLIRRSLGKLGRTNFALTVLLTVFPSWGQSLVPFQYEPGRAPAQPQPCTFTGLQVPQDTIVLAAGSYSGRKAAFQIDQSGHEATQFDIAVHADKPVALILGAYEPSIWNIGWTRGTRIVAVYATGYHLQVVAGLPKDIPVLTPSYENKSSCGYAYIGGDSGLGWLNPKARALFGRDVTRVYNKPQNGVVEMNESSQPKGDFVTSSNSPPSSFRDTKAPLAGTAGLEEAVSKGIIRPVTAADIEMVRSVYRERAAKASATGKIDIPPIAGNDVNNPPPINVPIGLNRSYVVLKQFTYPAGLYGGNLATFLVPKGVPKPTGNPGHSTVVNLSDDSHCAGPLCR